MKNSFTRDTAYLMTRKDNEKDAERPHYYSQFWLDVAAGRREIGGPKPGDEAESAEAEAPEPVLSRKAGRDQEDSDFARASADGRAETLVHPVAEPKASPDDFIEPAEEVEEPDVISPDVDELDLPDSDIPDVDLEPAEEAEEEGEDEFFDEEDEVEEEEDEDLGWSGSRRSKKPKPIRPKILPKKPRRDTRRGF